MSELGTRLQTARLEKGYSLDELQQLTKIQKRYLEAIEEGDFSKMPGEFYSRAFVKSYSEAVGLDPNKIFEEHESELPKPKRSEVQELPPRTARTRASSSSGTKKSAFSSLVPTLLAILFIGAVGFAVWLFNQDNEAAPVDPESEQAVNVDDSLPEDEENDGNNDVIENENNEEENVENNEDNNADNNGLNEPEDSDAGSELAFEGSEGNSYTYTLQADEFDVELSFSGPSWIQILDEDGEEIYQQEHADGDSESFDFSDYEEIMFNMGSTVTAELLINGEELIYESEDHHQRIIIQQDNS
ncbi:RodZ domain-containing protein [Alkalicoccus luteus]|uniref:Helix-turn-helix domain-containing protein n=1 Tax=Alkalicoccus luteus TaxID=1237094 RepID=A0A969TTR9_9BACI|nr:helix-turn-helix domain-containing protein [Alkalicoccus luteus]